MDFTPDMTLYAERPPVQGRRLHRLRRAEVRPGPSGEDAGRRLGSADGRRVLTSGDYGESIELDATASTSPAARSCGAIPDNFVGVHGSHHACPPAVGMIRGSFGPCGTAKLPAPIGNIWVIPTNVGEWHILTEDGFYLTRLFQGDPMKIKWPEKAVPGAVIDDVPPGMGGEDFGGSICYARDGKLYVQAGKTGFWNLEVVGLDTVQGHAAARACRSPAADVPAGREAPRRACSRRPSARGSWPSRRRRPS